VEPNLQGLPQHECHKAYHKMPFDSSRCVKNGWAILLGIKMDLDIWDLVHLMKIPCLKIYNYKNSLFYGSYVNRLSLIMGV